MNLIRGIVLVPAFLYFGVSVAANHLSDDKIEAAKSLLENNGIDVDIAIDQYLAYSKGGGVVSGFQLHKGYKVFDSKLTFHFGPGDKPVRMPDGSVFAMGAAQDLSDIDFDTSELIESTAAIAVVRQAAESSDASSDMAAVRRCVQDESRVHTEIGILQKRPVWQVRCTYGRSPGVFVDAREGQILESEPSEDSSGLPFPLPN